MWYKAITIDLWGFLVQVMPAALWLIILFAKNVCRNITIENHVWEVECKMWILRFSIFNVIQGYCNTIGRFSGVRHACCTMSDHLVCQKCMQEHNYKNDLWEVGCKMWILIFSTQCDTRLLQCNCEVSLCKAYLLHHVWLSCFLKMYAGTYL